MHSYLSHSSCGSGGMCEDGIVMGGRLEWRKNCKFNVRCALFVYVWERKEDWEKEKRETERLRRSFNVWENVFLAEKMNRAARLSYLLLKSRSSPADQQASGLIMYLHSKNIHPDTSVATPLPLFTCLSPAISPVWFHLHKFFSKWSRGISINCLLIPQPLSLCHF